MTKLIIILRDSTLFLSIGSPFNVKIGGEPSERITERIMRHQQAVDVTHVGSQCELSLKIPGESSTLFTCGINTRVAGSILYSV